VPPTTSSPSPSPSQGTVYTWSPQGGTVAVRCIDNSVSLVYATPATGWRLETEGTGPAVLQVKFVRGGSETQVHVTCERGVAHAEIESN
jgi:hypothetical protein